MTTRGIARTLASDPDERLYSSFNMALRAEERDLLDELARKLGVTRKQAVMAAVRAYLSGGNHR